AEPSDRRTGRNGAVRMDDPACSRDCDLGGALLPCILDLRDRDLADGARLLHDAQPGRAIGGAAEAAEEAEAVAAPPPPLNGGGCSTGFQSFLSGVITAARTFLSGQFSPVNSPVVLSFFGPPFS